jgi:hypothetical protein
MSKPIRRSGRTSQLPSPGSRTVGKPDLPRTSDRARAASKSRSRAKRHPEAKIDEVYVNETTEAVSVKPRSRGNVPDHPDAPAAIDRRRQIVGSDEPRSRRSK